MKRSDAFKGLADYFCWLIVTEPMDDAELRTLAETGDTSGRAFVSLCIDTEADGMLTGNLIARRIAASDWLTVFGVEAWAYDEYGVETLAD